MGKPYYWSILKLKLIISTNEDESCGKAMDTTHVISNEEFRFNKHLRIGALEYF